MRITIPMIQTGNKVRAVRAGPKDRPTISSKITNINIASPLKANLQKFINTTHFPGQFDTLGMHFLQQVCLNIYSKMKNTPAATKTQQKNR